MRIHWLFLGIGVGYHILFAKLSLYSVDKIFTLFLRRVREVNDNLIAKLFIDLFE